MNDVLFETRPPQATPDRSATELSFAQQRLWFLEEMEPGRATYVIPIAIELRGALDAGILEQSLQALVKRHESLRTVFVPVEGHPRQVVTEPGDWRLSVSDLSGDASAHERLEELLQREAARGFDLTRGPLFRARLFRLAADHHVLLLAMHHIVSDGWSMGILFRELGELYGRLRQGETATLPPVRFQYRDFAQWQRQWLRGEALQTLLAHWRACLAGAPLALELPTDHARPAVESSRGAVYSFVLPPELVEALRRLARREQATLFMPLLAGFAAMLARWTGQEDLLIGAPVANRNRAEFEGVVGCFVNTLALRADSSGDPTVSEFLRRTRRTCLDAFQHQDLPFERLVEELQPERDLSRNPIVQVMLSLENMPLPPLQLAGLTQRQLRFDRGVTHVDLTLRAQETTEGLRALLEYSTDLFKAPTIARMAAHWRCLLEAMAASPERRLSQLPLLTPVERLELLVAWNDTAADYPRESLVHELFEAQARRTPEATALAFERQRITYAELNRRSNQIGRLLRQMGVGSGARVGICLERSLEMVIGLLGILKAGAAYVPLDPQFPQERLRFMADDAQISALLTQRSLRDNLKFQISNLKWLCLDELPGARRKTEHASTPPESRTSDEDDHASRNAPRALWNDFEHSTCNVQCPPSDSRNPAYVIYTSGSTGKPKGVVVPHRAVVNFLTSMAREPGLAAHDVLVAVTTLGFDIAVLELLLPLTVGARVVIATRDQALDGRALAALLEQRQATVMQATPVTWRMLLEADWAPKRPVKVLVGGETLPQDLADRLLARGVELWNMFGPTETTVWSTCARITDTSRGITIGRPIANTTVRVLDARNHLCPVGVPGELFIGGDGVSLGYWNRPELTAGRFMSDPFSPKPEARLYRTGDRARWRDDGDIEHLGRVDFQVKLRGFRIEPGEIETGLAQHPAVREAVVLAREDSPGDKRLVAYLVADNPPADLADQLRLRLRAVMPDYMIPARFVLLTALPRTPNGKLDRRALPAPVAGNGSAMKARGAPRTPTEELVLDAFRCVLGRTDVGTGDSFFDLGGHSLMAARLMVRLRAASGFDLPMRLLFDRPSPASLAEAIDGLSWMGKSKAADRSAGVERREEITL